MNSDILDAVGIKFHYVSGSCQAISSFRMFSVNLRTEPQTIRKYYVKKFKFRNIFQCFDEY